MTGLHAIGIDIGGSKIAAGLVYLAEGKILARRQTRTDRRGGGTRALAQAVEIAGDMLSEAERRNVSITGIGVGVPELIDTSGIVRSRYNFEWMGLALREHFTAATPPGTAPVIIESDVRAAARAEMLYGAGRDRRIAVYITIGTGISYCLCVDGRPYSGAHGYAIHFASSPLSMRCGTCGSIQTPIVEEIASGLGLARAYAGATGTKTSGAEAVLNAAAAGDPKAIAVIEDAARLLGASIGLVINMLDPEAVVIGGGLGTADGPYWPAIVEATRAHIFAEDCRDLPILQAQLSGDEGIIGAAAFAGLDLKDRRYSSISR